MAFTRGQTQVLYQFLPGAVFEHDQYGFCKITGVELQEKPVNQDAVFNAVSDLLFQWPDDTFRGGFADPRLQNNRRLYAIGTPAMVRFEPFPTILECRRAVESTASATLRAAQTLSRVSAQHARGF
ncbi:MAG: hypothetical protein WDO73_26570 [Ignavibacteriota bacterium]